MISVEVKDKRRTVVRWLPKASINNKILENLMTAARDSKDGFTVTLVSGLLTITDWQKTLIYRVAVTDPLTMHGTATFEEGRANAG